MNLSFVKKFSLWAVAGVFALALAACLNPIGLPSYGSTQGSTGGGEILPGEGRLIIKNLTRDLLVHQVSFTPLSGQDSAPDLEPGPEKSNQRSVTLPAGLWKITLVYGAGFTTSLNDVMITEGNAATVYFYKTNSGRGSLETQWLPPPDADLSGNANPGDILSDDEGFLHVINKSALSYVTGVEYNNGASWIQVAIPAPAGMSGNIAPGQSSAPDLILPRGSWAIRFRLLGKDIPTVAVSKTISAGQHVEIEYTDSLLTDRPPSGFGSLRIVNNLPDRPITRVVVRTQANNYAVEEVSLTGSIPQNGGSQIRALFAGDSPGARRDYIVQCYTAANEYYEEVARIIDETISEIFITEGSSSTTEDGGGSGGATAGALTVYNRYTGRLPFKVFKIYLYRETAPGVWQDYVPPGHGSYPQTPGSNVLRYNETPYDGEPFLTKGDWHSFASIPEGAYKMLIVGGSYHWQYYLGGHIAGGIQINEARITYDCGTVFIPGGGSKIYNFDPYRNGFNDRDTPTGAIRINFLHAGNAQGQYGDVGLISRIQFVAGSESQTAVSDALVYNIVQSNRTVLAPQASENWVRGGVAPRFVVYEYNRGLAPGETLELLLPPGIYGVRVFNPAGDGSTPNLWYGRDQLWFYDLHIAKETPNRIIDLQWRFPGIALLNDDLARDMTSATVTDRNLQGKFQSTLLARGRNLQDWIYAANGGDWGQYQVVDHTWFFYWETQPQIHPAPDDPTHGVYNHYYTYHHELHNPLGKSRLDPRLIGPDGYLYWPDSTISTTLAGFPTGEHGAAIKQHGYYTLILTLEAKTNNGVAYTFRGLTPSNDPPVDPSNASHQGTGFIFGDSFYTGINGPGFNNPVTSAAYRIRHWGGGSANIYNWTDTDGGVANTGELRPGQNGYQAGKSRIQVRIRYKLIP
ncbi:MAG: hypothetical protein LBC88_10280 [Spirochaetaceae bacterium]|jgi:hypothetical protein|nr:hypothetical protein [Spirochaetaceae bacterium]